MKISRKPTNLVPLVTKGDLSLYFVGCGSVFARTLHFPDNATSWRECAWSCGVIIDDRIFFTSDTQFDREFVEGYDKRFNFEVIFHDCQLFTGGVHTSIDELCSLPKRLRKKIVLMHYGDNWQNFRQQAKDAGFQS